MCRVALSLTHFVPPCLCAFVPLLHPSRTSIAPRKLIGPTSARQAALFGMMVGTGFAVRGRGQVNPPATGRTGRCLWIAELSIQSPDPKFINTDDARPFRGDLPKGQVRRRAAPEPAGVSDHRHALPPGHERQRQNFHRGLDPGSEQHEFVHRKLAEQAIRLGVAQKVAGALVEDDLLIVREEIHRNSQGIVRFDPCMSRKNGEIQLLLPARSVHANFDGKPAVGKFERPMRFDGGDYRRMIPLGPRHHPPQLRHQIREIMNRKRATRLAEIALRVDIHDNTLVPTVSSREHRSIPQNNSQGLSSRAATHANRRFPSRAGDASFPPVTLTVLAGRLALLLARSVAASIPLGDPIPRKNITTCSSEVYGRPSQLPLSPADSAIGFSATAGCPNRSIHVNLGRNDTATRSSSTPLLTDKNSGYRTLSVLRSLG